MKFYSFEINNVRIVRMFEHELAVLFLANVWFACTSLSKAVGEVSESVIEKTVQAASTKHSL